jgi:hypothetical protein
MDDPQLERRKLRTALWLGVIALGCAAAFIVEVWLR